MYVLPVVACFPSQLVVHVGFMPRHAMYVKKVLFLESRHPSASSVSYGPTAASLNEGRALTLAMSCLVSRHVLL